MVGHFADSEVNMENNNYGKRICFTSQQTKDLEAKYINNNNILSSN